MTAETLQEYVEQLELERRDFIERLAERDALLRDLQMWIRRKAEIPVHSRKAVVERIGKVLHPDGYDDALAKIVESIR